MNQKMAIDDAVRQLRTDPHYADLVRDAYLDRDVQASTRRFHESGEFAEVLTLLGERVKGATIVDLGAGTGIATYAFIQSGVGKVYAVEPDPSDEVGRGAITRWCQHESVEVVDAFAERLPLPDASIDIYYGRQVLHHIGDLKAAMREAHRVLKPGGVFIACREHTITDDSQLEIFLMNHPVHQLAGGENAYRVETYLDAIRAAGLHITKIFGPLESVINAFPAAHTRDELHALRRQMIQNKVGRIGALVSELPLLTKLVWRFHKPFPGQVYTFVALKPV